MAVEEGEAGVVGGEVDLDLLVAADHDDVFDDAGGGDASEVGQFEAVAMEMDGVDVVAGVAHVDAVAAALMEVKRGGHVVHGEGDVVDGPAIEAFCGGVLLGEGHLDGFIGRR